MTKAEIKQMENEKKHNFISKTVDVVLQSLIEQTKENRKKLQVRINFSNYNRYIRFHIYGKDIAIQIYGDGNVGVELKEFCHADYVEQLFEYDADVEKQETFLNKLEEMMYWMIPIFLDKKEYDFHTYMDYVSRKENVYDAYNFMIEDYPTSLDE